MSDLGGWFFNKGASELGPFSQDELFDLYRQGGLSAETPVWTTAQSGAMPMSQAFPEFSTLTPPILQEEGWTDLSPRPWRRYFARTLDLNLNVFILGWVVVTLIGSLAPAHLPGWVHFFVEPGTKWISGLLATAIGFMANVPLMAYYGSTLGKWIFGIRVHHPDGRPLGLKVAFKRELAVFVRGYCLMIPLVSLFTLAGSYQNLNENGSTSWDKDYGLIVRQRPDSDIQNLVSFFAVILTMVGIIWLNWPNLAPVL
jgi:uncharacterized RDD family membrane protein YckC